LVAAGPLAGAGDIGIGGEAAPPGPRPPIGRLAPIARLDTPGGYIQFYAKDDRFTATCENPLHGSCVVTRYAKPRSRMKGRPCGFLSAWLASGALTEDKEAHFGMVRDIEADFECRRDARVHMMAQPDGPLLLSRERNSSDGLDVEPAAP